MSNVPMFNADFSDAPERAPAPQGKYQMTIYGLPKMRLTQKGDPMLVFSLRHIGENASKYSGITENCMIRGAGAFKLRELLRALGHRSDENGRSLVTFQTAEGKDPQSDPGYVQLCNTREGAPTRVLVAGQPVPIEGQTVECRLKIRPAEGKYPPRSEVDAYLAKK